MAILDALQPQLARLRTSYAKTPLPRFFAWWSGELLALLPARWREALAERAEALLLETDAGALIVRRQSGEAVSELACLPLAPGEGAEAPSPDPQLELARLRNSIDVPNLRIYYCIPAARTLRRTLSLPVAAEDRLRQVLAFEMDRQTPFKADQVYFDYRVLSRDAANRFLHVDLTVLPRAQLDAELAPIASLAVPLDGVDCWRDRIVGTRLGINLLPSERRAKHRNLRLRLNLALVGAAVLLLLVVMAQSVSNRESALAAMTEAVTRVQNDAKQVSGLRKTLEDTIESANFLAEKKRGGVTMVELLDDLTQRLPDNTYLERLNVTDDGRIELQGLSDEAPRLIERLQQSAVVENPSFQGVIQPDPRLKKDRFNLIAQLKPKEASKPASEADSKGASKSDTDGGNGHAAPAGSP